MRQWYELLFENYAHKYDKEGFVQGTAGECDFIEAEIKEGLLKTNNKNVNFEDVKKLFDYGNLFNKNGNSVYKDISEARLAYESWRAKMAELDYLTRKNELGEIQEFKFIAANIIEVTKSRILSAGDRLPPLIVGRKRETDKTDTPQRINRRLK